MAADVDRWAAAHATRVLARAEEEAVAELKDALVRAALSERAGAAATRAEPSPSPRPAPTGEALWAYCVASGEAELPGGRLGIDEAALERVEHDGLTALVSAVPLAEFAEEPLHRNLNDLAWLERIAREHASVLEKALEGATIVPLRLCTIFADEDSVKRMLDEESAALMEALQRLRGREEWGVKLLVDRGALESAARSRSTEASDLAEELDGLSGGGAYIARRRLEREVRQLADGLAAELAENTHARLQDWASDAVVNPPQNRELSGHSGEMLLNGAYLVEADRVPKLREMVLELEERYRDFGAVLELTGPWPPYNFVPQGAAR